MEQTRANENNGRQVQENLIDPGPVDVGEKAAKAAREALAASKPPPMRKR